MNVAELVATLVLDSAGFQSEIRKVDTSLTQTGQKAEGMAQTLGTSVESAVESSVSKAGKSFAKLAKMANGALAQWDGSDAVQKAAKACQEQVAVMEKSGVAEKAAGTLTQGLEQAQSSAQTVQSRLPKWLGAQPETPEEPTSPRPKQELTATATISDDAAVRPLVPEPTPSATEKGLSSVEDTSALLPVSVSTALVMPPEMLEGVADAVSAALQQAVEREPASSAQIIPAQEQQEMSELSAPKVIFAAPPLPELPPELFPELAPDTSGDVGGKNNGATPRSDAIADASDYVAPAAPDTIRILPENLQETLSADVSSLVTAGVSESVAASMEAITPQAAESFAQSGAQLAQAVLTGLQNSVAAVLEKVPVMVSVPFPEAAAVTGSTQNGTEFTPETAPDPQSTFPVAAYEPLAVTPPKAEPFAADFGNTITSQTSISQITINSQATDAEGIAEDIGGELERRNLGYQFDGAYSV